MADLDYMSSQLDVEHVYGRINISKWADSDNQQDPEWITERIDWSNKSAQEEIWSRLVQGKYSLEDFDVQGGANPIPYMATLIAATRAGLFLYDTRRVVNDEDADQVSSQRKMFNKWIKEILAGQLRFTDPANPTEPLTPQTGNAPGVVTE